MPIKKGKKPKKVKVKGKKDGKQESKKDKESDLERAKGNAAMWEMRCDMTETSRIEFYEAAELLTKTNEQLIHLQHETEKRNIDIIAVLREKDEENDEKIAALEQEIQLEKASAHKEKKKLVADFTQKFSELEKEFEKKCREFNMTQDELQIINDFRKKKPQMEMELQNMKEAKNSADLEHKKTLMRMEEKFLNDKAHLETKVEQKIAELAEKAHDEAIVQLDGASRSVFKENVRLNKALSYHIKEVVDLRKRNAALAEENDTLIEQTKTSQQIINGTVSQMKTQRMKITDMKVKVSKQEQALTGMVAEFERGTADIKRRVEVRNQAGGVELDKLQKILSQREKELSRIKKLARSVVEQRTDTEILFHEALNQVKHEISMQSLMNSNVKKPRVNVSEMSWEQRERVIRLLFARMNSPKAINAEEESNGIF